MSHTTDENIWRWAGGPDAVRTLWFDQPGRSHNVLDGSTLDALEARLVEIANDRAARGLVIRSAKPAGFCGGVSFETLLSFQTSSDAEAFVRHGLAVFDRLSGLAVPTVAVIHGACIGGGLELALACRRRVALASAAPLNLGLPEVHFGLIPAWGALSRIPCLAGPDEGLNLLITGRTIGYLLARSHHIVDRLASDGDSIESPELFSSDSKIPQTWSQEDWDGACDRARAAIDEEPHEYREAQRQILTIIAIHRAHGREAAREATVKAMAELALSDIVRKRLSTRIQQEEASRG